MYVVQTMSLVEFGEYLKHARELSGLSLDDIERRTKIRVKYLIALEKGNINVLQSEMQLYGFVRSYAQAVSLEPDSAIMTLQKAMSNKKRPGFLSLLSFRKARTIQRSTTTVDFFPRKYGRSKLIQRKLSVNIANLQTYIIILLVISLLVFFWWGSPFVRENLAMLNPTNEATIIILGATVTPTFLRYIQNTPTSSPSLVDFSDINLTIIAEQRTFVQIIVDGSLEYQGVLQQGDRRDYYADQLIELTTGNGKGVSVTYNQRVEGVMGEFGETVTWVFTPNEMMKTEFKSTSVFSDTN